MCVESDECEIEGCSSSDEVHTLSGSMSPALKSSADLHPCKPGQKFRAALLRCRSPLVAAGILSFGNVLNYMDRYTVAGVLLDIQKHFDVGDSSAGLLQTGNCIFLCDVNIINIMKRKYYYWLLVLSRCLVGIGESSYSSISPTIIGDLFTNNKRTVMLSVFYLAIPLGSGLGYILGSIAKDAGGDWFWALRVSPMLGLTAGTLILIFVTEPKRGNADYIAGRIKTRTSWLCDMKALAKNRSYVFSSLASAAVSFATGAFGIWIPQYLVRAQVVQKTAVSCTNQPCSSKDSLIFGAITCVTGLLGVVIGAVTTRLCRQKTERADPLVCAVSMLGSAIFICLIFVVAKKSIVGAYICIFIGETLLFLNWAITADILMYVVIPTRRATAVAFQGFTSHLLGDAGSPYLIGLISDSLQQSYATSALWQFLSLGYALMLCPFVIVLGGMFFLATALFFLDDRDKAENQ
uniref:Major facilitator superfamily (MFS) profile domain-containing protein n=1 Tax=Cyprinus carpio TaxID=7962 RepID=A0A8C2A761_CYPCA